MDKKIFFSFFEEKIRVKINDFCLKINQSEADLYILMARKATCLVMVLEELSLISLNGKIISERLLDTKISWDGINRIIIIDDVIISGTTLNRTIKQLKSINPNFEISVFVIGINEKWYNEKLLEDDNGNSYVQTPIKPLEDSQCIRLSGDIVKMLSMYPMPYNIDFPIYQTIKLNQSDFKHFMGIPGWEVCDTSSQPQKMNNIFSYTFLPDEDHLSLYGNFFNNSLISESLIKIRIYGKKSEKKKEIYSFSLVPMAVLPPMKEDQIQEILHSLAGEFFPQLVENLTSITSKLRFIQFIIADRLAGLFISEIDIYTRKNVTLLRKSNSLRLLFPESLIGKILEIADNLSIDTMISYVKQNIPLKKQNNTSQLNNYIEINNALNKPFLDMYYNFEIPARKLAYRFGQKVFKKPEFKEYIDRLKNGYSLLDLNYLLNSLPHEFRIRVISSFLDKAIDNGIAVPITVEEGDIVYRAFRHGEDVQWGQREERLCFEMLNAFVKQVKKNDLQKLWIEKLIVFFLKIGENKFLEPVQTAVSNYSHINGTENNIEDVASVKYFLQGPVVVKHRIDINKRTDFNPCLDFTDKGKWLTKYFISNNTPLKLPKASNLYNFDSNLFNEQNHNPKGHDKEIIADTDLIKGPIEIGAIFGFLINNSIQKTKPSIDSDELVALSSCCEPKDVIGALAAEIFLSSKVWSGIDPSSESAIYENLRETILNAHSNLENIPKALKKLHKSPLYRAINDGQRKFYWYLTKHPKNIISRISSEFEDIIYKGIWDNFWSPNIDWIESSEKPKVIELAKTKGVWLLCANLYISMLELTLLTLTETNPSLDDTKIRITQYFEKIKQFAAFKKTREIIPFAISFINKINDKQYLEDSFNNIIERIDTLMFSANLIVKEAEDYYINYQVFPEIKYCTSALYIEIGTSEGIKIINNTFQSICYKITKTDEDNPATLKSLPKYDYLTGQNIVKWFVGSGKGANFWLAQLAHELMSNLGNKSSFKIFLFPDIPNECSVKIIDEYKIKYNEFWLYVLSFSEYISQANYHNKIIYTIRESKFNKNIFEELGKFSSYVIQNFTEKTIRIPNVRTFKITSIMNQEKILSRKSANIGILTVVTEEQQAVLSSFDIGIKEYTLLDNRFFYEKEVIFNQELTKKIVVLQSTDQGNLPIISAYYAMIKNFELDYLFLVGIAGSIQEKIHLCDVIIGTSVIYYEKKKESGPDILEKRGEFFNNSFRLAQILNQFFTNYSEPSTFKASIDSIESSFNLFRGPIGSGETIIADQLSKTKQWLKNANSKTVVVETESAGLSRAWYESNTTKEITLKDIIIIRGISDHADYAKDDKWRLPSSNNAVIVLKELVKFLY